MPAPKKRVRLSPEARHAQLVRCAVKVAAARGLGRIVHADVAKAAKVAVPTAFLYFPNRQALLSAVIEEIDRFYMHLARAHHTADTPPLKALEGHMRGFGESVASDPDYAMIWLEWSTLIRNEFGLWDAFLNFQERIIRIVTRSIRRCQKEGTVPADISAPDSARLMVASSYTLAQLKFMQRNQRLVDRYTEHALQMILHHRD